MSVKEDWRTVWRKGFAPLLSDNALNCLRSALIEDDATLRQGVTTVPPPLTCVMDWPVEAACVIGYCAWKDGRETIGEVEEQFARLCWEADQALGGASACRYFLNWFDDTPRETVFAELLPEVEWEIARRTNEHS